MAALALTGSWLPAVISAAGAPFIGLYAYRLNHPASFSLTYAPWVLLAMFRLEGATSPGQRVRAAMLLSITASLVLVASPPKEAVGMLLGLAVVGVVILVRSSGYWIDRGKRLGVALVGLLLLKQAIVQAGVLDSPSNRLFRPTTSPCDRCRSSHAIALALGPSYWKSIAGASSTCGWCLRSQRCVPGPPLEATRLVRLRRECRGALGSHLGWSPPAGLSACLLLRISATSMTYSSRRLCCHFSC
jgi:hypothetical protein